MITIKKLLDDFKKSPPTPDGLPMDTAENIAFIAGVMAMADEIGPDDPFVQGFIDEGTELIRQEILAATTKKP